VRKFLNRLAHVTFPLGIPKGKGFQTFLKPIKKTVSYVLFRNVYNFFLDSFFHFPLQNVGDLYAPPCILEDMSLSWVFCTVLYFYSSRCFLCHIKVVFYISYKGFNPFYNLHFWRFQSVNCVLESLTFQGMVFVGCTLPLF